MSKQLVQIYFIVSMEPTSAPGCYQHHTNGGKRFCFRRSPCDRLVKSLAPRDAQAGHLHLLYCGGQIMHTLDQDKMRVIDAIAMRANK